MLRPMVKLKDYKKNFQPHDVPDALSKLVEFDAKQDGYFASGFELAVDDKGGMKTWSDAPEFLGALFPIGQANGSGSTYAFWQTGDGDLASAPVIVFGDEGGVHVVAANLAELLRLLSYDTEPMIDHDEVTYYKDPDDHEPSDGAADYTSWLAKTFKLKPAGTKDVTTIVKAATKAHGKAFATWMKKFYAG